MRLSGLRSLALGLAVFTSIAANDRALAQDEVPTLDVTPIIDAIANPSEPSDAAKAAYQAMAAFDTAAHDFPQEMRDDLSQCDNADAEGMLRAVRECWPVYEFYRVSAPYRKARITYQETAADLDATFQQVDAAYDRMVTEAMGLREISKSARYPAQFEVSLPAHVLRFFRLSHSRKFAEALADVEEQIAAKHSSKAYIEDGFHNPILHYSRIEMSRAIDSSVPYSFLARTELARPIGPEDTETVFANAFFDREAGQSMQLGVDPARAAQPDDCNGIDYQGLLRAIRYCEPIFRLYNKANSASSSWRVDLSDQERVENLRVIERARQIDLPAADFFELVAHVQEAVAAFGAGEETQGDTALAEARGLYNSGALDFAPEMLEVIDVMKERANEVVERMAQEAAVQEASAQETVGQ